MNDRSAQRVSVSLRRLLDSALPRAAIVAILAVSMPVMAQPVATVELTGEVHDVGLSGYPGSKFTLGDADSNSRALVGLLSRERSDKPCEVSIGWEDVNRASDNDAISKDLCGGNGPTSSTMGGTYGPADRVFVTGVQLCMDKSDDRVKGIHLKGKRISDTGTLTDFGPDQQDSRTNCHQDPWKRWVNCGEGEIATAAIAHYSAGNTPRSWTGVGLQCRALRVTGSSGATPPDNTGSTTTGLAQTIDCTDTDSLDLKAVAWNIADDWRNFSSKVETATGENVGSCLAQRFSENGKVQCEYKEKCKKDGDKCKLAFGGGLDSKIKIFGTFFDYVKPMTQPDRRACYAAIMTHEFSHTCERYGEGLPEARAVAAFDYWKERFAPASNLDIESDCGMND